MTIVKFPYSRREAARRPRRSKNGTPEERDAKAGVAAFRSVPFKPRRSKNGTPEERAAKQPPAAIFDLAPERANRVKQHFSSTKAPLEQMGTGAETPTESEAG
jgi:hypothetical protein